MVGGEADNDIWWGFGVLNFWMFEVEYQRIGVQCGLM